jgi:hypothetical protein
MVKVKARQINSSIKASEREFRSIGVYDSSEAQ